MAFCKVLSQGDAYSLYYEAKQNDGLKKILVTKRSDVFDLERCIHCTKTSYHEQWIHRIIQCIHHSIS